MIDNDDTTFLFRLDEAISHDDFGGVTKDLLRLPLGYLPAAYEVVRQGRWKHALEPHTKDAQIQVTMGLRFQYEAGVLAPMRRSMKRSWPSRGLVFRAVGNPTTAIATAPGGLGKRS